MTAVPVSDTNGSSSNHKSGSAVAVAGGVIGGLAFVGLLAFLVWYWKRRTRKRRSSLLTPLSVYPSLAKGDKEGYTIQRGSIGPTPRSAKIKASVRAQYNRVRGRLDNISRGGHSGTSSVDMNRGAQLGRNDRNVAIKERLMKVWALFGKLQWRGPGRSENNDDIFAARGLGGSLKEKEKPRPLANKPELLTEDDVLDSEAQRRRSPRGRGGSLGTALGGLGLDFSEDPFSDVNATTRTSANPPPPLATGANNPFSDANAIAGASMPGYTAYVPDSQHSRGQSADPTIALDRAMDPRVVNGTSRPPSDLTAGYAESSIYFRDSASSFDTRRNKFRSDPFDLEPLSQSPNVYGRPVAGASDLPVIGSSDIRRMPSKNSSRYRLRSSTIDGGLLAPWGDAVRRPVPAAHARNSSLGSSRYTSGVSDRSMDDWAVPGPNMGPRAV